MNAKMIENQGGGEPAGREARPVMLVDFTEIAAQQQRQRSLWADPQAMKSLEDAMESLASTFLAANLNFRNQPLKEFIDGFEKHLLLACLRLTGGHQRNAAAILGVKPTALFEKMRKHGINGRQMKLRDKLAVEPSPAVE